MAHHAKQNKTSSSTPSRIGTKKPRPSNKDITAQSQTVGSDRIAKVMARAGVASRRESERMIEDGRVSVNGKKIDSPALNVSDTDVILVNGRPLPNREITQLWRFHKPKGCVTSHKDPEGRELAFDHLPKNMGLVISVGRLDYNTEGLLLLTNDGGLSRYLELPTTGWLRRYRVRVRGSITQHKLDELKNGITVDGVRYGAIDAQLNRQDKANLWITVSIREGKNREIRRIFEALGMTVSRLIRISYGPFMLGDLASGQVEAIKPKILVEQLGEEVAAKLGIPIDDIETVKPKRLKGKPAIDDALKSKKPGNPKGGRSLKFGGKRKFTDQNAKDAEGDSGPRRSSRRTRNSVKSQAERSQNVRGRTTSHKEGHDTDSIRGRGKSYADRRNQGRPDNRRSQKSESEPTSSRRSDTNRGRRVEARPDSARTKSDSYTARASHPKGRTDRGSQAAAKGTNRQNNEKKLEGSHAPRRKNTPLKKTGDQNRTRKNDRFRD